MELQEFTELIKDRDRIISDEDFALINKIYNFHPAVKTKKDIATLFMMGEMALMHDMELRADSVRDAEEKVRSLSNQLEEAMELLKAARG